MTTHDHNVVLFSMPVTNPCTGGAGHADGGCCKRGVPRHLLHQWRRVLGDRNGRGTATFTPDDPSGVSATGHFTSWFGESSNNQNDVQHDTNTFQLTGTDGSHTVVHATDHLSTNANGVATVNFSNVKFSCG
jgi:hypothetical protein